MEYAVAPPDATCVDCGDTVFNKNIGEGFNSKMGLWCRSCKRGVCSTCVVKQIQTDSLPRCHGCANRFLPARVKEVLHNAHPAKLHLPYCGILATRVRYNTLCLQEYGLRMFVSSGCRLIPAGATVGLATSAAKVCQVSSTWFELQNIIGARYSWCCRCGHYTVRCTCEAELHPVSFAQPRESLCSGVQAAIRSVDDLVPGLLQQPVRMNVKLKLPNNAAGCTRALRPLTKQDLDSLKRMYGVDSGDFVLEPCDSAIESISAIHFSHWRAFAYAVAICRLSGCTLKQLYNMHGCSPTWPADVDPQTTVIAIQAHYIYCGTPLLLMSNFA